MSHEMTKIRPPESGVRAAVLLNERKFNLVMNVLGAGSDAARARLLDSDTKALWRYRRRGAVGSAFIAKTLHLLRSHETELRPLGLSASFEEVFEVGEAEVQS